ncbi:hypothetical protein BJY01DRAFT_216237 [Aspergillus pseudoustus]|uniref:Zn(2)-C6 fungal-type domain-containing protein n=1 Tax=Aspergillus pseudoustus TaxID=1810923 RepID=A0ABR4JSC6_9EURO
MGGLPYTSNGCANCKKRKIKCDLGAPECARCKKKGILCPGYDQHRNFLHHTVVSRVERNGETKRPVPQLVGHLRPLALPPTFNMSAEERTQLFSTFMSAFFAPKVYLNGNDDSWYFLMSHFPSLAGESEILDRSVIALASVFVGGKTGNESLARHGVEIYNSGLNMLVQILKRKRAPTPDVLYATMVFNTYETIQGGGNALRNCFFHVQGATAIVKHFALSQCMHKALGTAIMNRQKWSVAFFGFSTRFQSEVDWSCLTLGYNTTPLDNLFNMLDECAALQRELRTIVSYQTPNREAACEMLLHRCSTLESRLTVDWLNGPALELDDHPTPCPRIQLAHQPSLLFPDPAVTPYTFKSLNTAKTYLLFWVAVVATCRVVYQAETLISGYSDPSRMIQYAGEISRAIPYCIQPSNQMSSGHAVIFAVSQASRCYIDCGDRSLFEWCQGIYAAIHSRGVDIARGVGEEDLGLWAAAHGHSGSSV